MGNQPLCTSNPEKDFSSKDFYFIRTIQHPLLGDLQELQSVNSKENVFLKIIQIPSAIQDVDIDFIRNRTKVKHPNHLKIHSITTQYDEDAQNTITTIYIHFETFDRSFDDEINLKRSSSDLFTEIELMIYLKNCIDVLASFQEKEFFHGNITPDTIYFTNQNQIKIVDPTLLGSLMLPGLMNRETDHLGKYRAPELMKLNIENHSISKGDVFSLGMTFLHAALLEDVSICYRNSQGFDRERLNEFLMNLENVYPSNLSKALKKMLIIDENERPDFIFLRNFFNELAHDKEIPRAVLQRASIDQRNSVSAEIAKRVSLRELKASPNRHGTPLQGDEHEYDEVFDLFNCCGNPGRKRIFVPPKQRPITPTPPVEIVEPKVEEKIEEVKVEEPEQKKKAGKHHLVHAENTEDVSPPVEDVPIRPSVSSISPEKGVKIYHIEELEQSKVINNSIELPRTSYVYRSTELPSNYAYLPRYSELWRYEFDKSVYNAYNAYHSNSSFQPRLSKVAEVEHDNRSKAVKEIIDEYKMKRNSVTSTSYPNISQNINPGYSQQDIANDSIKKSYYFARPDKISFDEQKLSLYENWYNQRLTNLIKEEYYRNSSKNVIQANEL